MPNTIMDNDINFSLLAAITLLTIKKWATLCISTPTRKSKKYFLQPLHLFHYVIFMTIPIITILLTLLEPFISEIIYIQTLMISRNINTTLSQLLKSNLYFVKRLSFFWNKNMNVLLNSV